MKIFFGNDGALGHVLRLFFVVLLMLPISLFAADAAVGDDTVTKVICNVINFVQQIGLPIMTGVIIGSSIMAIFGRLAWPAIVMLVVFTAIFFGASSVIAKFAVGIGNADLASSGCDQYSSGKS